MPDRFIRESALTSESLAQLSDFAERLFWRLTTVADDFGRFVANPAVIQGRTMPLVAGVNPKKIFGALQELDGAGAVKLYEADHKSYGYFPGWHKYQLTRAKKSKYPDPPTLADKCLQTPANDSVSDNVCAIPNSHTHSYSDLNSSLSSSDQELNPLDPNCSPSTALIDWFHEAFEPAYPEHRRVQQKTAVAWLKASKPDEHERARIMAVLGLWVASEEWKRESGNYVPGMGKFFSDGWHNRQPRAPNGVFPGMTTVELMKQRLAQTRAENAREATAK